MIAAIKFGLFLIFSFKAVTCFSQNQEYPFEGGERVVYGAYYNINFIWIHSGEVVFNVDSVIYNQQKSWHLKAIGKTFKVYDLLYPVRDTFETFCNYKTFKPVYSKRVINHGRQNSIHEYWFDTFSDQVKAQIRQGGKPLFCTTLHAPENTSDLLSTAYNFRKFDFDDLFPGQKVSYCMIIDREVANLFFRYLGKENVKTRNGKEYQCHKVSIYLLQGDFFPEGEYMKVWFTADKNHLPVQVETKILMGSVKALLLGSKNMKYPLTSQIK